MLDPGFPPFVRWLRGKYLHLPHITQADDPEGWDDWDDGRWNVVAIDLLAILTHAYPAGLEAPEWRRIAQAADDWFYPFNEEILEFLTERGIEPDPMGHHVLTSASLNGQEARRVAKAQQVANPNVCQRPSSSRLFGRTTDSMQDRQEQRHKPTGANRHLPSA